VTSSWSLFIQLTCDSFTKIYREDHSSLHNSVFQHLCIIICYCASNTVTNLHHFVWYWNSEHRLIYSCWSNCLESFITMTQGQKKKWQLYVWWKRSVCNNEIVFCFLWFYSSLKVMKSVTWNYKVHKKAVRAYLKTYHDSRTTMVDYRTKSV